MATANPTIELKGPALIFGGPYSNLQATIAVLDEARRLGIPPERTICTGDLAAYCADPVATIALVRASGIPVVMGNCDEQLGAEAQTCGCGFPSGSTCESLSAAWFAFSNERVGAGQRAWLSTLPRRIDITTGGLRLAIIHGSVDMINQFVFATTPIAEKRRSLALADCDGVIGGHCGLPFTQVIDGRLWHNAGVIGMPANDGTSRVWFSVVTPVEGGIKIDHRALNYDHAQAAHAIQSAGLPPEYRLALSSGIWPSCDVLPPREVAEQGVRLEPATVVWTKKKAPAREHGWGTYDGLLWPATLSKPAVSLAKASRPILPPLDPGPMAAELRVSHRIEWPDVVPVKDNAVVTDEVTSAKPPTHR
jgi:predicted phosphodiesterase